MAIDPGTPLPDLSPDEPAGPNLEFDSAFAELERQAQGKPEQQYGSTIVPAEDPEWKDVVASAWALLERTYDLRVFSHLAVGRLQREGVAGYAETLDLIKQVLDQRWAQVHPQLDPEDDNDPTLRANALLAIAEPVRVMRFLRHMPLARSARAGAVSWRDIAAANGTIEVEDGAAKLTTQIISAAFRETDATALAALRAALASAAANAVAIPAVFDDAAGFGTGPDLTELVKLLRDILRMMDGFIVADDGPADDDMPDEPESADAGAQTSEVRTRGSGMSIASLGPISSRADAVRLLQIVSDYYERNEPSSPLPLLIARALRLADKSFMDVLRDIAPDGVSQAELIAGNAGG